MGNTKNLRDSNGNLIIKIDYNIKIKKRLQREYKNIKLVIFEDDETPFTVHGKIQELVGTLKNTLIIIECSESIMNLLKNEIQIQNISIGTNRRVGANLGRFNSNESSYLYTEVFALGLILIRNESMVDINKPSEVVVTTKDYTGYNSLTFMLANKFNKEFDFLTFESIKGTITEEFNIDGELYVINSRIDALEVSNMDGGRYTVYVNDSHCHKIPKVFNLDDFITIYETISKISGKTVALYQDRIEDAVIIEPEIRL